MNERQLLYNYKTNGNIDSLQSLVTMHRWFIYNVVKKSACNSNNFDDLIQEGTLGLIHAINKYDLKYNVKLLSYAVHWIRYYISRYIKSQNKYTAVDVFNEIEDWRPSPESIITKTNLHDKIDEATDKVLKIANSRERDIFTARYRDSEEITFEELGERYNISKQRVQQISNRTIDKIRGAL